MIVLVELLFTHPVQLASGQDGQQSPAQLQRLLQGSVLLVALLDKILFKSLSKLQIAFVGIAQLILTDDAGQAPGVLHLGVGGKQLVG